MNRETRRKLKITKEQGDFFDRIERNRLEADKLESDINLIDAGSKVKLKYDRIVTRADYPKLTQTYKSFVESNIGTIFTVVIEETVHNKYKLVSLEEDIMEPKFLFWVGDLELVKPSSED